MKKKKRPDALCGQTHRINTNAGKLYITVNATEDNLFEVFLRVGKHGGDLGPYTGVIGRFITLCLRYGLPLKEIIKQLDDAGTSQFPPTVPEAVAKILSEVKACPDQQAE